MSINPNTYPPASMPRVRSGWRSHLRSVGAFAGIGRGTAAIAIPK